jgi:small redox-active disulfide protein 2
MLNVKVLGPGCPNCQRLHQATVEALDMLGAEATIQHITDHSQFKKYRLLFTPGLVVNEKLVSAGRIPSPSEIMTFLTTALMEAEQTA